MPQNTKSVPWNKFTRFIYDVADRLILEPQLASRLAVLSYGRTTTLDIGFNNYISKSDLLSQVQTIPPKKLGGHFLSNGLKYISNDMNPDFRPEAKLVILLILSSPGRSDENEIIDAVQSVGRLGRNMRGSAVIHVIHSDNNSLSSELRGLQSSNSRGLLQSGVETIFHPIGDVENNALERFNIGSILVDDLGACVNPEIIVPTTQPILTTMPEPMFTTETPLQTTPYMAELETSTAILSELTTLYMEATPEFIGSLPPPPPPIMPPQAPPHFERYIVKKFDNVATTADIDDVVPTTRGFPATTNTPIPPTNSRKRRRPPPPPPPPPLPPNPPSEGMYRQPVTFSVSVTATPKPAGERKRKPIPPPPPPPPPPPGPPATIIYEPMTTPEPIIPNVTPRPTTGFDEPMTTAMAPTGKPLSF
jgi:hypothetical protein